MRDYPLLTSKEFNDLFDTVLIGALNVFESLICQASVPFVALFAKVLSINTISLLIQPNINIEFRKVILILLNDWYN